MTRGRLLDEQIETIARWIVGSERVVAFTGAGIGGVLPPAVERAKRTLGE